MDNLTRLVTAEVQIKEILQKLESAIGESVHTVELIKHDGKVVDIQLRIQTYSSTMEQ